jgi:iron complex outermembrane receptor protein
VTVTTGQTARQDFTLAAQPISVAAIDVVVGSRARHTAPEELAVPVDVFTADIIAQQGVSETSQILQAVSPSVNFPRQSVTDATDVVRPFTMRGLSPDHTLVLLNGWRRHQMAVVNTFAYGMGAGSSGVDMNAIPASAIDRIEVLRDGASAQYGSDAIAGVVNVVTRQGKFSPFLNTNVGRYFTYGYPNDGNTVDFNGGVGLQLGRGSISLFGEVQDRQPTNRAWADPWDASGNGQTDVVDSRGRVAQKNNGVPQPNQHWGDGAERDLMALASLRMPLNPSGTSELFGLASYSARTGTGFGYRRYADSGRNWPAIYPLGFLPEFHPEVKDYSVAGGVRGAVRGWAAEAGATFGHNDFAYNLENTLNVSLGPSLLYPRAPGADGILGTADDPGIPNKTSFFAGRVARDEMDATVNASRTMEFGLPAPVNVAVGAALRWERFAITRGELASYVDGGFANQFGEDAPAGSQVFPGFSPDDESSHSRVNLGLFTELETNLTPKFLANVAGRFEDYSDFGMRMTGKLALRYQPARMLTLRAAASTGFRAPGLGQSYFSKVITNVIAGQTVDIGVFPVDHPAALALGSKPLRDETSVNYSAGFAFTPVQNLTFTVDYFRIAISNRIMLGATFDDDTSLAILAGAGYGDIAGVQYFTNGLDTRTQGVDLTGDWQIPYFAGGTLNLTTSVNYARNRITRVDPLPAVLANSSEPGLIDTVTTLAIERERPDWRATVSAVYGVGQFHALLRSNYYGGFRSAQPGYCDQCGDSYGGKTLWDLEFGYRLGIFDVAIGARNLTDVYPDKPHSATLLDPSGTDTATDYNTNYGTFPWAAASPFGYNGRYVYTRVSMRLP